MGDYFSKKYQSSGNVLFINPKMKFSKVKEVNEIMFEEEDEEIPISLNINSSFAKSRNYKKSTLGESAFNADRTLKFKDLKKTSNENNLDQNQLTLKVNHNLNKVVQKSMILRNNNVINPLVQDDVRK